MLDLANVAVGGFVDDPVGILLIDPDDKASSRFIRSVSRRPWRVDRARDLQEALGLIPNRSYTLAIVEMTLPDAVGTKAWKVLRELQPGLFAIMVTASPSLHTLVDPDQPHVVDYLLKPIRSAEVRRCVELILGRREVADLKNNRGERNKRKWPGYAGSSRSQARTARRVGRSNSVKPGA